MECNKDEAIRVQKIAEKKQPQRPYPASSSNGVGSSTNSVPSKPTTQRNAVPPPPSGPTQRNTVPVPPVRRTDTFWTTCSHCKMQYEHLKVYLNRFLHCPSCRSVFKAVEVVPPVESFYSSSQQFNQTLRNHAPSSNTGRITVKAEPFVAAKASNVYQQAKSRLKRKHQESQGSTSKGEASSKRRVLNGDDLHYGDKPPSQMPIENSRNSKGLTSGQQGFVGVNSRPKSTRKLTPLENREMLMEKALTDIRKKLNEWKSEALNMAAAKKVEERREEEMKSATTCCALSSAQSNGIGKSSTTKREDKTLKNLGGNFADDGKSEVPLLLINVPDPDFHDFDQERTEKSFEDNQIWAAYDDDDGMPRFYAFVQKVISNNPFTLRISRLATKTNSEFGSMKWVKWTKGAHGVIQIVPLKGDIWALYRNWSSDWNEHTPDEVIHKYDMVEVLDDYTVEKGVPVTPLVKVAGFSTVFRPHHSSKIMIIPKEEMFRFSHQVPNYVLTGQEGKNAPKGCQELDPAATPSELLQVINEVTERRDVPFLPSGSKLCAYRTRRKKCSKRLPGARSSSYSFRASSGE